MSRRSRRMNAAPPIAEIDLETSFRALRALRDRIAENDLEHGLEEELAAFDEAVKVFGAIAVADKLVLRVVEKGQREDGVPAYVVVASAPLPDLSGAFVVPIAIKKPTIVRA